MLKVKLFEKIGLGGKDPMVLQILDLFLSGWIIVCIYCYNSPFNSCECVSWQYEPDEWLFCRYDYHIMDEESTGGMVKLPRMNSSWTLMQAARLNIRKKFSKWSVTPNTAKKMTLTLPNTKNWILTSEETIPLRQPFYFVVLLEV
jgi:hypothetical protein